MHCACLSDVMIHLTFTLLYVSTCICSSLVIEKDEDRKNLREMKPGEMFGVSINTNRRLFDASTG